MERRRFLTTSLGASALALGARNLPAQSPVAAGREYYELRQYHLQSGPQSKLVENYLSSALIPALNRLGMSPIGAFNLTVGPETPTIYVLIPSNSLDTLVTADLRLAEDAEFLKAADPFWNAPATQTPYVRIESTLLVAFEGRPKLKVTPVSADHGKRVFQLRTYESPTNKDHVRKVEMFHKGEFAIFERAGFWPVFYADALIGPRLPKLTYMLSFPDLAEMNSKWDAFTSDPEWKKLSGSPRYTEEAIVSNVTNLVLSPLACSQI
ncbi:NIPSNAP family protein [Acidicapsa ligni]|uniref:NIPSNAP family protein n=1 Tax=Acidicapsa ligni TaxID=542300 RepID=UPI0021E030B6|nr:NIPSNAP family protein [Acidicapsa ligni]